MIRTSFNMSVLSFWLPRLGYLVKPSDDSRWVVDTQRRSLLEVEVEVGQQRGVASELS